MKRKQLKSMRFSVLGLVLASLLAGCATHGQRALDPGDPIVPAGPRAAEASASDPIIIDGGDEADASSAFSGTETFPGSGEFINRDAANRLPLPADGEGEITLNFEGQGIQEVVHAILGSLLQENYVIAPGISGEVTFSTARPLARDQILPILEMLLRWNGATLIWRDDRFHVLPIAEAVRGNLTPRVAGGQLQRGYQVLAVPLRYVSPAQMQILLEPYIREDAVLSADSARSLLFLAGTRAELRNYMQIIETFDVDWLKGMSVGMFQIQRVEVADMVAELESVFGSESDGPLAGMFRIMPLERLNSIMVITPQEHYLREIERWIQRLDRSSPEAGARLYVYKVKNLDADVLAGYIGDVFGSTSGGSRSTRRESRGSLAPGLETATASSVSQFQNETSPQARSSQSGGTGGGSGSVTLGDNGDVRITAVMETNSLLIQASPSEYDAILNAIERLDEEPLQVLIEAQVLVVNLSDELQYGVSWFLANSLPDNPAFPGVPDGFVTSSAANNFAFGSGSGFLGTIADSVNGNFVAATINALEAVSDVRTISAPSLMVRNNADARINVGEQIPIQSQSFISGSDTGSQLGTTQFLNTGVILEVTPRVNPGGLVYLVVSQEVSSPGQRAEGNVNPPINTRQISTEIAVQSGQTVVLGGLISETRTEGRSGVPFLQRIPGLGALFSSTTDNLSRSETLVLITPTVVENTAQLQRASDEFGRKFRGLDPLRAAAPQANRGEDP